ncbi:uncharacterized protein LACBIDRAFT_308407 [Laccaria bicolor S238N-H82]|uniref:Predicted protein n=1 Tax=Laccaria bicolor (strain S238N-H82 / ATCC MYA-4686) TaxID=486041 RepID=B0CW77_LACBS|nr:uncharacterized protein LACBIDRAFT_308407 [Laccaria bicolor S238N-H82]EDR13023.1 predicted protein [Laccaria bicolor S238N-H82]|eukprot:XP_001875521.1 predicted protein [Laccaria bicolor S238N-H82]
MTRHYLPDQWKAQERAYNCVLAWLGDELAMCPTLNFKGAFFIVTIKEGDSEIVHIDWSDSRKSMTWVFTMGDWEGAEFVAPQIGVRVPVNAGHLFRVMLRMVAHFTTPIRLG